MIIMNIVIQYTKVHTHAHMLLCCSCPTPPLHFDLHISHGINTATLLGAVFGIEGQHHDKNITLAQCHAPNSEVKSKPSHMVIPTALIREI